MTTNKGTVSLELIPRSFDSLYEDACIAAQYSEITHINIPHLNRFPVSSIEAELFLRNEFGSRFILIPHLVSDYIRGTNSRYSGTCLLVSGDEYSDVPLAARETPHLVCLIDGCCYVAVDQYRGESIDEIMYLSKKIGNGACGVFTQPFFCRNEIENWDKKLPRDIEVFYGLSPVVNEKSRIYWEEKNKVIFPKNFDFSMESHIAFTKTIISWAAVANRGVYLMPIRVSVKEYLRGVFNK